MPCQVGGAMFICRTLDGCSCHACVFQVQIWAKKTFPEFYADVTRHANSSRTLFGTRQWTRRYIPIRQPAPLGGNVSTSRVASLTRMRRRVNAEGIPVYGLKAQQISINKGIVCVIIKRQMCKTNTRNNLETMSSAFVTACLIAKFKVR